MKKVVVRVQGISPLSQSRCLESPKIERETHDEYERRCCRERIHSTQDGDVYIPPMAFVNCMCEAAKRLSIPIPGKGKSTYTKSFDAGLMCTEPMMVGVKKDDVPIEKLFVPSDGVRGSGKRVFKYFPRIDKWGGTIEFYILDDIISREVFERVLNHASGLIGLGRFRPQNRGYYGRFRAEIVSWEENVA